MPPKKKKPAPRAKPPETPPLEPGAFPDPDQRALDVFYRDDPGSLINLVPPAVGEAFVRASKLRPDLMGQDERHVWKKLHEEGASPSVTDNRVRIKFWLEYDRAMALQEEFTITNILAGVCSRQFFYHNYLTCPEKVAWLLCPPANYLAKMQEILDFGLEQLRDVMDLPNTTPKGWPNTALIAIKARIVAMAQDRLQGSVVQKLEQKSVNVTLQTTDKAVAHAAMMGTMDEIDRRISELQLRDRQAAQQRINMQKEVVHVPGSPEDIAARRARAEQASREAEAIEVKTTDPGPR